MRETGSVMLLLHISYILSFDSPYLRKQSDFITATLVYKIKTRLNQLLNPNRILA